MGRPVAPESNSGSDAGGGGNGGNGGNGGHSKAAPTDVRLAIAQALPDALASPAAQLARAVDDQLGSWRDAITDPVRAQKIVLRRLLADYAQTGYGSDHGAASVAEAADGDAPESSARSPLIAAYREAFPVMTYDDYKPFISAVLSGETAALLSEEPVGWAITRGTTQGESKFIPMTPTDLRMRVSAGRAMMSYVAATGRKDLFAGVNLNLNFPSVVGTVKVGDKNVEYGYSSGIYTKYVSKFTPIRSVPSQDEIDALGGGTTRQDWDDRFELALEKCKGENVTLVGGVCQTALEFGRYLRRRHGVYPKQLWKTQIMTLGSTPGINTRHAAQLTAMYGPAAIREIYGTTEGMFGQQPDDQRAWAPNFDLFFFEVLTRSGIKMLHDMKPGETGSLVVSTPTLARYRIGDTILALRPPYFRCIGREKWWTRLDYYWNEMATLNLGRL
jgi:GH3 auxin-responsive promoter